MKLQERKQRRNKSCIFVGIFSVLSAYWLRLGCSTIRLIEGWRDLPAVGGFRTSKGV
jgi:hypothetical protein